MSNSETSYLIYDGQCPFCSAYVKMLRLKEALGRMELLNARDGGAIVQRVMDQGYDLDEGMVLVIGDEIYHGADCIHRLSLMTTGNSSLNRLNASIFRSQKASRLLYPILRMGRNTALRLLGRRKIGKAGID